MPAGLIAGVFLILGFGPCFVKINIVQAGIADHLVINEIQVDGIVGTGGTDDDFLEIFNPTNQAVDLAGWSIQKTSSLVKLTLSGTIQAGGYFLIVRDNASTTQTLKDLADLKSSTFSMASNNIVFLVNDDIKINNSSDINIVDFVGFGTVSFYEGLAAASNPGEETSISRKIDGEDSNDNSLDFNPPSAPTPKNSKNQNNDIGGTVLLTITPDINPVQNIIPTGADIVFHINTNGTAKINYGLTAAYGNSTADEAVTENITKIINLTGLACATTYHYSIQASNTGLTENDNTADAVFTTLPCGITLNSLDMIKTTAKANDKYIDGWVWEFNITVWDIAETDLKMKFDQWSGAGNLNAGANMQFSVNNGLNWFDISANSAYPALAADISGIDASAEAGRQVKIQVKMKVPARTTAGNYSSNYGILTE
jgi:hypothetical protein